MRRAIAFALVMSALFVEASAVAKAPTAPAAPAPKAPAAQPPKAPAAQPQAAPEPAKPQALAGFRTLTGGARAAPAAPMNGAQPARATATKAPELQPARATATKPENARAEPMAAMIEAGVQIQTAMWKAVFAPLGAAGTPTRPGPVSKGGARGEANGARTEGFAPPPEPTVAKTTPTNKPAQTWPFREEARRPPAVVLRELEERKVEVNAALAATNKTERARVSLRQDAFDAHRLLQDADDRLAKLVKANAPALDVVEAEADRAVAAHLVEDSELALAAGDASLRAVRAKHAVARARLAETHAELEANKKAESEAAAEKARAEAEVVRAQAAAEASAKDSARKARVARGDQYLAGLLERRETTAGYRRAAARVRAAAFNAPKPRENANEATEDAVAMNPEKGLFAISDGVTNAVYSGPLARLLVQRWTSDPAATTAALGSTWLRAVQADWARDTGKLPSNQAWFNANARGDATFLGARLVPGQAGTKLDVMGIGDSMVFVVRRGAVAKSFPYERSSQFTNVVETLPSKGSPATPVREVSWAVLPGDEVFMTTDALGKWVLAEVEAGRAPFAELRAVRGREGWSAFVRDAQAGASGHPMDVDDTSLLRFVVPQP
jgi:hypothetical protein